MSDVSAPSSAVYWRRRALGHPASALVPAARLVNECAEHLRLLVKPLPYGDPLLSGAQAFLDRELCTIWYDASLPGSARCLILAHELAHAVLHIGSACDAIQLAQDPPAELQGYSALQRRERDADRWAADLLLPYEALEHALSAGKAGTPAQLASLLEVPISFVWRRFRGLLKRSGQLSNQDGGELLPKPSILGSLDPTQQAAACTPARHALVTAGPGTGKTRTLAARFEHLVREQGVSPDSILIATFSRRAAGEISRRLSDTIQLGSAHPWIGTVHAFAYEMLNRFSQEAGLPRGWRVLSRDAARELIDRRIAADLPKSERAFSSPLDDLLVFVARYKELGLSRSQLAARCRELSWDDIGSYGGKRVSVTSECDRFRELYDDTLAKSNSLDFTDLLVSAGELLKSRRDVLRLIRDEFRHVLIDEVQDLSPAARRLFELLAVDTPDDGLGARPAVWAVGDSLQAIYAFQTGGGGSVDQFNRAFSPVNIYQLGVNYRSAKPLVDSANRVAAKLTASQPVPRRPLLAGSDSLDKAGRLIETSQGLFAAASDEDEYDAIAERIDSLQSTGVPWTGQAVLCRTNAGCAAFTTALMVRGIPVSGTRLWTRSRAVRQLMQLLEESAGHDSRALAEAILVPSSKCAAVERRISAAAFLQSAVFASPALLPMLARRRGHAETAGELAAVGALLEEAVRWERETLLQVEPNAIQQEQPYLRAFARHIRRLIALGSTSARSEASFSADGVQVLTVHAAKGLEFDAVFVPNLIDGVFPSRARRRSGVLPSLADEDGQGVTTVDEESCLFYVAVTRARRHLFLSYSAANPAGRKAKPSPFLRLIETNSLIRLAPVSRQPSGLAAHKKEVADDGATAPILDARLQLDADGIELYETCPRRYWYERQANPSDMASRKIAPDPLSALQTALEHRQRAKVATDVRALAEASAAPQTHGMPTSRSWLETTLGRILQKRGKPLLQMFEEEEAQSPALLRRAAVSNAIAQGRFPAAPDSAARCAECPYCFRCPD